MTKTDGRWDRFGWVLWLLAAAVFSVMVALKPLNRTVTPIYHEAVANWTAHRNIYSGPADFNYLPSFVPFFGLFAWLPLAVCEVLWRWAAVLGLAIGLWRCCGLMLPANQGRAFSVVTVVSLPVCLGALRNGQSSAQLAAALVWAAVCLQERRWGWSTAWLCLSLICKPLALPALGLAVMAYPHLWWRVTLGMAVVFAGPYLFGPPGYVTEQYGGFVRNITECFDPGETPFADLNGVLMVLHLKLTGLPSLIVRVAAGAAMAIGCWLTRGRSDGIRRVLIWLGFTGIYIMLFTPMNEANSYVMLAPALGLWAWWHFDHRATGTALTIAVSSLTMVLLPNFIRPVLGGSTANKFGMFWCPLMTLVFLGILLQRMKETHGAGPGESSALAYDAASQ